jgi:hypothetical protein
MAATVAAAGDLLALSCTLPPNLVGAAHCVRAAHEAGVPVVAGGRMFGSTPRRGRAIGADGWAAHPFALMAAAPVLAQRDTVIDPEAVLLDAVDDVTVSMATTAWSAPSRGCRALPPPSRPAQARTCGGWAASPTSSLCGLLDGRVPADVIAVSAQVVADTVEPFSPSGARLLRQAVDRLHDAHA